MSQHGCPERLSNRSKGFQEDGAGTGAQAETTMEVLVETLTGTAFEMTVSPSDTIFAIKSKICRVEGIPVSQQHIVFGARELEDAWSLDACGVGAGARLRLVLGLRGGPVSTRRLPPPAAAAAAAAAAALEPWPELDTQTTDREEDEWSCGGPGCRVTVVVFRDGERVNMLRVRENPDGTYSPAHNHPHTHPHPATNAQLSSPLPERVEEPASGPPGASGGAGGGGGALAQNAVTMSKMMELRRRMESLAVRRNPAGEGEIQKTRSEETLSAPRLEEAEYSLGCGACAGGLCGDRLKLGEALGGSGLLVGDPAILEECLGTEPLPTHDCGPLVGGEPLWRTRFGSSSQLSPPHVSRPQAHPRQHPLAHTAHPAHARSASSLHVRAHPHPHPPPRHALHSHAHAHHAPPVPVPAPLSDALFSSSTSDLEQLRRNRLLPALSRHRNTEHLHLSDEHLARPPPPPPPPVHRAPAPEPAGPAPERRQRRIDKITQLEHSRLIRYDEADKKDDHKEDTTTTPPKEKKKIRCGLCRKRLSIATVHRCRCGAQFCAPHRYAEVHGCAYDYKAHAHLYLQRANPLVSAPKLPKI